MDQLVHQRYPAEAEGAKTAGLLPRLGWVGTVSQGQVPSHGAPQSARQGLVDQGTGWEVKISWIQFLVGHDWSDLAAAAVLNTVRIKKKCSFYAN